MAALSPDIAAAARKIQSTVLQHLARTTQTRIAEQLGVDGSQVSRFADAHLQRAAEVLAACGLKVVPVDAVLYDRDVALALTTLARGRLQGIAGPEDLACE
jgi:hypothetical protein